VEWERLRDAVDLAEVFGADVTDADWHDARAADTESDGRLVGARWHLERLLPLRPGDWKVQARLARVLFDAGERARAEKVYRTARAAGGPSILGWYRLQVGALMQQQRWDAARWYLDRLVEAGVDDWQVHARRAEIDGRTGQPARREADLMRAVQRGGDRAVFLALAEIEAGRGQWQRAAGWTARAMSTGECDVMGDGRLHALACLNAGDLTGYRRAADQVVLAAVREPGRPAPSAANAVWLWVLGPASSPARWDLPMQLLEEARAYLARPEAPGTPEEKEEQRRNLLSLEGAVLHRAGKHHDAVRHLGRVVDLRGRGGSLIDRIFLALAYQQLGDVASAKRWQAAARPAGPQPAGAWDAAAIRPLIAELSAIDKR
jgi:Flp pilus assembly protein TadD